MENREFKEAKSIELHDSNVRIHQQGQGYSTWYCWSEAGLRAGSFLLPIESLKKIACLVKDDFDYKPPEHLEGGINILKRRCHVGDPDDGQETIKMILAKIESANLLTMKLTFSCENTDDVEDHIQTVTYSGNFTVWWA